MGLPPPAPIQRPESLTRRLVIAEREVDGVVILAFHGELELASAAARVFEVSGAEELLPLRATIGAAPTALGGR